MIPSPGLQRSPRVLTNRPCNSEISEKIGLKKFTSPLEPESRDVSYWNYENDCFRVDRKQIEDNGFSSPDQYFTPDSWREREETRLKRESGTPITPKISFDDLQVQGTSFGKDETNSQITKENNQKDPRLGKICGTQNYYKLDPAECDADYASLRINGQKASVKSPAADLDIPPVRDRDEEEKEYVFSFGKCGRVAVLTPITEVPSQCVTPYHLTLTPTFSEEPLSPVSSISFESLFHCSMMKNQYLRCDRNEYEIVSSPQEQLDYVPSTEFVKRSKSEKTVPQDPLVKRFELLSILPERTRAAYNLPPIPVCQFGVPGLSVSSAPLLNRYYVRKIEEKPRNRYAYKCLPPLYPTGHLEKGAGNKRLPIGSSKSVYGLTSETRRVMNSDTRSVSKPSKDSKTKDDDANHRQSENNRRKSDSEMRDFNSKLPPIAKLSRKKTKRCNKKRDGEKGPKKSKRGRNQKVAKHATIIDPSPWIERPRNLVVVSEVETMVGEKITHTYSLVDQEEPEEKLQSLSWSHTNHELSSNDSDYGCAQMSESLSKGSVMKKKKRKHGFRNRKK